MLYLDSLGLFQGHHRQFLCILTAALSLSQKVSSGQEDILSLCVGHPRSAREIMPRWDPNQWKIDVCGQMLQLPYLQEDSSEAFPQGPLKGPQRVELQWLVVVAQSLMHVSLAFLLSCLIYFTISRYFLESFSPPPNKLLISKPCLKLSLDATRWWWYIVIWYAHLWNRSFKKQYLVQSIERLWYFLFLSLLLDMIHWSDLMTHSWVSACSLKTTIPDGGHVNTWVLVIRAIW